MKRSGDLRDYFIKRVCTEPKENREEISVNTSEIELPSVSTSSKVNISEASETILDLNDIGISIGKVLSQNEIHKFLKYTWTPGEIYSFPVIYEGKQKRSFQLKWLKDFSWLAYSDLKKGAFCKFCSLFAPSGAGIGSQPLKTFVTQPLRKYKNALEDIRQHAINTYHINSMQKADEFLKNIRNNNTTSITSLIDKTKKAVIESNRNRLVSIVKTVIFCAQNNLPLRGHRDDGPIGTDEAWANCLSGKEGVFRSLLAFRIDSGDNSLIAHLKYASKNATMISKTIQNEIICAMGHIIRNSIVEEIKKAKFFSILCDETTDVASIEQMTLCIRYVDMTEYKVKELFLGFVPLKSTTGANIKEAILKELLSLGLSKDYIRGQGYDGGSNMSGKYKGAQALILLEQPLAFYTHCANHALNLAISNCCEVSSVKNMMGIVSAVSVFLNVSAKRLTIFQEVLEEADISPPTKKKKLKNLCATRWVERHDAVLTFKEFYSIIIIALERLETDSDTETSSKAVSFGSAMKRSDFLIALEIVVYCFSFTIKLSKILQSPSQDLSTASSCIQEVLKVFEDMRLHAEIKFKAMFEDAKKMAESMDEEIKIPRICGRQAHRTNVNVENKCPESFYRQSIFNPFLDHFISQLKERFNAKVLEVISLEGLIPKYLKKISISKIIKAALIYEGDLHCISKVELQAEVQLWKNKWENIELDKLPENAIQSLISCDEQIFPNIKLLLQLFATLPVTTASAERSFSYLRRLKTYLRSTMGEKRLNGLALANIHKERAINVEEVIQEFARMKPRRLKTEDWTKD